jgi:hypothetical protein
MKVRLTFTDELLGTASANPDLYAEHLGKKCADKDLVKEEIKSLHTEELVEKSMTIFHRKDEETPILYDYQIRGFIKEAIGATVEFGPITIGKTKVSKWTYKRFVDNFIFVTPRELPLVLPKGKKLGTCTRPLRADTLQGPRIALAHSEAAPEGTIVEFEVSCDHPKLEEMVIKALDYGSKKGIGQWRNSGKGRFTWVLIK